MRKLLIAVASVFLFATLANAEESIDCDQVRNNGKLCLACNIYHEARGESLSDQIMVGHSTMARVKDEHYPNEICAVVWQPWQYSWTNDGNSDVVTEPEVWREIIKSVSELVLMHWNDDSFVIAPEDVNISDLEDVKWYHNDTVNPDWTARADIVWDSSAHTYYKNVQ